MHLIRPHHRLNWTKIGLKPEHCRRCPDYRVCLNWTKIGLKLGYGEGAAPVPTEFELD